MTIVTRDYKGQIEIFQQIKAALEDDEMSDAQQPKALQELKTIYQLGWGLRLSNEGSPADQAGIDFILYHRNIGWYAIDCTNSEQAEIPALINVAVLRKPSCGDQCDATKVEDWLDLAEFLVQLAKQTPILKWFVSPPPCVSAGFDNYEELYGFQRRLNYRGRGLHANMFREWSNRLQLVINFEKGKKRHDLGIQNLALFTARFVVREVMKMFTGESRALSDFSGEFANRKFDRSKGIVYLPDEDLLIVPDTEKSHLPRILVGVKHVYEMACRTYAKRGMSEKQLSITERIFENGGWQCIIHELLDAIERKVLEDN